MRTIFNFLQLFIQKQLKNNIMSSTQEKKQGSGLIDPNRIAEPKKQSPKKIPTTQDGLMEREEEKVITEDGRELLKEN